MSVCYFLQTHRNPGQIHRLVRTLVRGSPHARVIVSHDFTVSDLDAGPLTSLGRVTVERRDVAARRGSFSSLQPYLDAVDRLLDGGVPFDWLVALSGQDYPVRPIADFESHLAGGSIDGVMPSWDALGADGPWGPSRRGHRRYYFQYREPPPWMAPLVTLARRPVNSVQSFIHIQTTYGARVGVRARQHPFSASFRCHVGQHRHALSRPCVAYLREALRAAPSLVSYYGRTLVPEESLVQTVLVNSRRFRFSGEALHFADTEGRRDGTARTLTRADLPAIIASGRYFARKFDTDVDAVVLDRLDARLEAGASGARA